MGPRGVDETFKTVSRFRSTRIVSLVAMLFTQSLSAFGQADSDPWLILASGEKGSINAHTTRKDLVRLYGASNVTDEDVDIGEGEMQSATLLFPNDSELKIEILWKDPDTKTEPVSAGILEKKSRWHTAHGITLGTSIEEMERVNGRPFRFALTNDGTDMADETISWQGGSLRGSFKDGAASFWRSKLLRKQSGPHDFEVSSDNPAWRAKKPRVSRISWIFPSNMRP